MRKKLQLDFPALKPDFKHLKGSTKCKFEKKTQPFNFKFYSSMVCGITIVQFCGTIEVRRRTTFAYIDKNLPH